MKYEDKLLSLVLLRLKDEDLSKLSDQELLDKVNQTSETFKELLNEQKSSEQKTSFD